MAFDQTTVDAIASEARRQGIDPAAALAIAEVESGGVAFATVNGKKEPLIRFEGHYFDKRLTKAQQAKARAAGLSDPRAGAVKNPVKQADRWRVLNRAIEINAGAALESCSWGIGQVMGSHWKWLGFGSVTELVNLCRRDVAGQMDVMFRFIDKSGLGKALAAKDWKAFARGYNGPAYAKNAYDTKMAAAYKRWAVKLSKGSEEITSPLPIPEPRPPAIYTDKPTVMTVQTRLKELGYTEVGGIDGKIGTMTKAAILAFRSDNGLELVDHIDANLIESLARAKPRVIAPERKEAPPEVVREKASGRVWGWLGLDRLSSHGKRLFRHCRQSHDDACNHDQDQRQWAAARQRHGCQRGYHQRIWCGCSGDRCNAHQRHSRQCDGIAPRSYRTDWTGGSL